MLVPKTSVFSVWVNSQKGATEAVPYQAAREQVEEMRKGGEDRDNKTREERKEQKICEIIVTEQKKSRIASSTITCSSIKYSFISDNITLSTKYTVTLFVLQPRH
jgi:hypothetical protein